MRSELADRIAAEGIRTEGQATPHLLMLAALHGVTVLGPVRADGTHAFALTRDWLGEEPVVPDRDEALAELGRGYLAGHAPAGAGDLAVWAGIGKRDATKALRESSAPATSAPRETPAPAGERASGALPPRLLPAFDPYLLGWKDRTFAVAPEDAKRVYPGGGIVRATAIADGLAVGTWTAPKGKVALDLFGGKAAAFSDEAAAVERFLGA